MPPLSEGQGDSKTHRTNNRHGLKSKGDSQSSLIIERPDLQTATQKYGYLTVTFIFWAVYMYLWLPLLSLTAWSFGIGFFYEHMINLGGYEGFLEIVGTYAVVIVAMATVFLSWARINYIRFKGVERRRAPKDVSLENLSTHFNVAKKDLAMWQLSKSITLHHDEHGEVVAAKINTMLPAQNDNHFINHGMDFLMDLIPAEAAAA